MAIDSQVHAASDRPSPDEALDASERRSPLTEPPKRTGVGPTRGSWIGCFLGLRRAKTDLLGQLGLDAMIDWKRV